MTELAADAVGGGVAAARVCGPVVVGRVGRRRAVGPAVGLLGRAVALVDVDVSFICMGTYIGTNRYINAKDITKLPSIKYANISRGRGRSSNLSPPSASLFSY